ncbi:Protein kinase superfamily protein [Prunus dulcis]|uniref:Protein kinase superfamily protein n=1 Tax=Prunus dulcis TaxID=3755 RepID=A0A5H2XNN6_PRUDU|nr:Protein kinase superfamily protein [Prunus dulcis]
MDVVHILACLRREEGVITSCDGKSKPIRSYSSIELMRATNNFDPSCIIQHFPGFSANESLPWKTRVRIAKRLANALTYPHTAFPKPIIHRDLTPRCIFLDHDFVAKLCNFSLSKTIRPMQSHADEDNVKGTIDKLQHYSQRNQQNIEILSLDNN